MKSGEVRYFNFPIQLLDGFMDDSFKCLNDIFYYSIYAHSRQMNNDTVAERIEASLIYYHFKINDFVVKDIAKRGNELYNLYNETNQKSPTSSISVNRIDDMGDIVELIWTKFYKQEKKQKNNEFDKICLLAFLALRSILGKKASCKTNNELWLARMSGKVEWEGVENLPSYMLKYARTKDARIYYTSKIKTELEIKWGLVSYSHRTRGFFISFKMNKKDLAFQVEKNRYSNKVKELKEESKQAREDALLRIKNNMINAPS